MMTTNRWAAFAACAVLAACGGGKDKAGATDDDAAAAPAANASSNLAPPAAAPQPDAPSAQAAADEETSLSTSDEKLATGQYYDAYPLTVQEGKGTVITVRSQGFKPAIVILDSNREKLTETVAMGPPDANGGYTVEMSDDLPAGSYYVIIAAWDVGATGRYSIEAASTTTTVLN